MSDWVPKVWDEVVFPVNSTKKRGRIYSGPRGLHQIYTVKARDGSWYDVPVVLLEAPPFS